jgi:outer membrane protein OmpA-like peptidoglycan-associated protein
MVIYPIFSAFFPPMMKRKNCLLVILFVSTLLSTLSGQEFRVQIGAFGERMDTEYFKNKGIENFIETSDQLGLWRYFAGVYRTKDEADIVLAQVQDRFPNATIIDIEEQRILCGQNCPYFRNGQIFISDPQQKITTRNIYFDFGRYSLTPEAKEELAVVYESMKSNPDVNLKIMGYTDAIGSKEANIKLSTNRARSARNYLINRGIRADRMFIKVFGEADPALPNKDESDDKTDSPENRKWNRRVALILIDDKGEVKTDKALEGK